MAEPMDGTDDLALWRRWRSAGSGGMTGPAPDPLLLAAYAEDRLTPDATASVEAWLAGNPDAVEDLLAARKAASAGLPEASEAVVARAMALVDAGDAEILSFPPPQARPRRWRLMVARGGIAASLLIASLIGFAMGNDAYVNVASLASLGSTQDLIDPPGGLFTSFDEEPSL